MPYQVPTQEIDEHESETRHAQFRRRRQRSSFTSSPISTYSPNRQRQRREQREDDDEEPRIVHRNIRLPLNERGKLVFSIRYCKILFLIPQLIRCLFSAAMVKKRNATKTIECRKCHQLVNNVSNSKSYILRMHLTMLLDNISDSILFSSYHWTTTYRRSDVHMCRIDAMSIRK